MLILSILLLNNGKYYFVQYKQQVKQLPIIDQGYSGNNNYSSNIPIRYAWIDPFSHFNIILCFSAIAQGAANSTNVTTDSTSAMNLTVTTSSKFTRSHTTYN